ncbi:LysR family transcriptional regulator [Pseudonocardia sp. DLS-67]
MDLRALRYFVAVAEERNIGRAAARLAMTQPPLSRAMRLLEADLGVSLLDRTASGVTLTGAGETLYDEARTLLGRADRLRVRVAGAAGPASLAIGTLADTAELLAGRLAAPFRRLHPHVEVSVHEADLGDPTAGLRTGLVDVALTREPFDATGVSTHVLSSEPVGVVVHEDDPIAGRTSVSVAGLADRRWVRLPDGADPVWTAYWTGGPPGDGAGVAHTIQECLQAALWNGTLALAPLEQVLPPGLVTVPVDDRPRSRLVLAWRSTATTPLVRSFVTTAADVFRRRGGRDAPA